MAAQMSDELRFDDRVAIITGAGRGMGRAHAQLLAARGAKVVINDLDQEPADEVVQEIVDAGGTALASVTDITDQDAVHAMVDQTIETFGRVDILVNNAALIEFSRFEDMTQDLFERSMKVNAWAPYFTAQAVWRPFLEQGFGRIIMVSSGAGLFGMADRVAYAASKSALIGMTRTLASEADGLGITANVLFPSAITRHSSVPQYERYEKRFGASRDVLLEKMPGLVSPMVAWLSHEDCTASGEVLEAGEGYFRRVAIGATRGFDSAQLELSIETVRDNWEQIVDLDGFQARDPYRTRKQWSTADKVPAPGPSTSSPPVT